MTEQKLIEAIEALGYEHKIAKTKRSAVNIFMIYKKGRYLGKYTTHKSGYVRDNHLHARMQVVYMGVDTEYARLEKLYKYLAKKQRLEAVHIAKRLKAAAAIMAS